MKNVMRVMVMVMVLFGMTDETLLQELFNADLDSDMAIAFQMTGDAS